MDMSGIQNASHKRVLEPFGAFHGWQTAGLNASTKLLMWPGRRRKAMDMALVPGRASLVPQASASLIPPGVCVACHLLCSG